MVAGMVTTWQTLNSTSCQTRVIALKPINLLVEKRRWLLFLWKLFEGRVEDQTMYVTDNIDIELLLLYLV